MTAMRKPLSTIRKERYINVSKPARLSGVSKPTIYPIEAGHARNFEIPVKLKIAAALGLDPSEITEFAGNDAPSNDGVLSTDP